ncbi:MAG: HDIG domain-containing protein [Synergistaceae bacterium]|nr:HDIG domain-containing protein [Synergistaceae bacterium]
MNDSANLRHRGSASRRGPKKYGGSLLKGEGKSADYRSLSLLLLVAFALTVIFLKWFFEDRTSGFLPGEPSPRTYFALFPFKYTDDESTSILRARVGDTVAGVLVRDGAAMDRLISKIESMAAGDISGLSLSPGLTELINQYPEEPGKTILMESARLSRLYLDADSIAGGEIAWSPENIWREIEELSLPIEDANVVFQILDEILQPLVHIDADLTRSLREEIGSTLQPVERKVAPGDVIVDKGQIITDQAAGILEAQGYSMLSFPWKQILFALTTILLWPLWLATQTDREAPEVEPPWLYLSFIVGLSWIVEYVSSLFSVQGMGSLFLAGCSYLTLPAHSALQLVMVGGILGALVVSGFSTLHVLLVALMGIVSAFGGYFVLKDAHSRGRLWKQLFLLGLLQTGAGLALRLAFNLSLSAEILVPLVLGIAVWSSLVIAALPLFEDVFDVLSPLRLIELSHPSNPLLKRLQMEAPGTYHHSLMLGTLAETIADKLDMNANLLKAGAYFHDIGKLRRPEAFVENQMGGDNIHDELKPSLSALVIIAHVREGLELAQEYHLPRIIRSFIAEHHGTTALTYFLKKAESMGTPVPSDQFRYPGPRPQSKETGLLMLIDSVEAAVRSEFRAGADSVYDIGDTINRVVDAKIAEGQLDDVDFTLRDLSIIKETLLSSLRTMYHTRKVKEIKESAEQKTKDEKQEADVSEGSPSPRGQ